MRTSHCSRSGSWRATPNLVRLNAPYDVVAHPVFLLVVAVLTLLDLIGDKIPAVDHALHLAGMVRYPRLNDVGLSLARHPPSPPHSVGGFGGAPPRQ